MPFECSTCGEKFYSKTALREHEMIEEMRAMSKANSAGMQALLDVFARMERSFQIYAIFDISRRLHCSFADACTTQEEQWNILSAYNSRRRKEEEEKHEH